MMYRSLVRWSLIPALLVVLSAPACTPSSEASYRSFLVSGIVMDSGYWRGTLHLPGLALQPGDPINATVEIAIPRRIVRPFQEEITAIWVAVVGERIYDAEGRPHRWTNLFGSTVLTPTGMPVEGFQHVVPVGRLGHPYGSPIELTDRVEPERWKVGLRELRISTQLSAVGEAVPAGYYRLHTEVFFEFADGPLVPSNYLWMLLDGMELAVTPLRRFKWVWHGLRAAGGQEPIIRVGQPERPKMIWTILSREAIRGMRGVVADEDRPFFAISNRFRFPGPLIVPKGRYDLNPDAPLDFSTSYFEHGFGATRNTAFHRPSGSMSIEIVSPSGNHMKRGPYPITELHEFGPRPEVPLEFDLDEYGEYRILLTGQMTDRYGWTYDAGGTYRLWVAEPLTVSTSVKPGVPFLAGDAFPNKVVIHPPVPAQVTYEIEHLPRSDPSRREQHVIRGCASPHGYFVSTKPEDAFRFTEPGEYVSYLTVRYRQGDGPLFMGAQTSAGIVAERKGPTRAHGRKWLRLNPDLRSFEAHARFASYREGKHGDLRWNHVACIIFPLPYYSGDVLYMAERLAGGGNISNELSLNLLDAEMRRVFFSRFPHGLSDVVGYLYRQGGHPASLPDRFQENARKEAWFPFHPCFDIETMGDMLPLLSATGNGWHPAVFPEERDIVSYYYLTAMRPGLLPKAFIADSTAISSYWRMNNNTFDNQYNAGHDGDLAGDIYRFHGGTVYRHLGADVHAYAAYSSVGMVEPSGGYNNRVVEPFSEPLLKVNGRELWAFLGIDPALVVPVGGVLPLAGLVFPTVATDVRMIVTAPDGKVTLLEGRSNEIGTFFTRGSLFPIEMPGVYKVDVQIDAKNGRTGDLVGSGNGVYNIYAVDSEAPSIMQLEMPPVSSWDPATDLVVPIRFPSGLREKRLTWSTVMPGVLMDEGSIRLEEDRHEHRFRPRQFRRQFSNYDWPSATVGRHESVDTVLLTFFLEAIGPAGQPVHDVAKVTIRENRVYATMERDAGPSHTHRAPVKSEPLHATRRE